MGKNKEKARKPPAAHQTHRSPAASTSGALLGLAALGVAVAVMLPSLLSVSPSQPHAAAEAARSAEACADTSNMCDAWHKAGMCASPKRNLCRKTCGECPGVAGRGPRVPAGERCRRDNTTAAVPAGQLGALFERILAEFPQYSPVALSRDPYVIRLDDFVTDEEAAAIQEVCRPHFERSLAGDQLNPVRTSFQCWCNFPGCFANAHVHRVTQRINAVTGTAYDNGEDLQIVRYEPNQFYKRHHDQNTGVWTPQGPRVLTFFMYLNEPGGGGETNFPSLGFKVTPKKGSAILWPSTLDAKPLEADGRTDHEAMPVHSGIKFGANMWIHQFSFKTPSERRCELTYVNTAGKQPVDPAHKRLVDGLVPSYAETLRMISEQGADATSTA